MKVQLKKALAVLLCAASAISALPGGENNSYNLQIVERSSSSLRVRFQLNDYRSEKTLSGYDRLIFSGTGETYIPSTPQLPSVSKIILLPDNMTAEARIVGKTTSLRSGFSPEICNPDGKFAVTKYQGEDPFPANIVSVSPAVNAGGLRFAALDIFPFRYIPSEKALEVTESLDIEITFVPSAGIVSPRGKKDLSFANAVNNLSLNPEPAYFDNINENPGGYLIIVPDSSVMSPVNPLKIWKTLAGYDVNFVDFSQIGTTAEELKTYLTTAYQTWDVPPQYVLLVGDIDGEIALPAFYYQSSPNDSFPDDFEYTLLEGDDYFPEIEIGRLSVQTEDELAAVIAKTLKYETDPFYTSGYLNRAVMIADTAAKNSLSVKQWARELLLDNNYSEVDTHYFFNVTAPYFITTYINSGAGIVNFRGLFNWGGYTVENIHSLTNWDRLPVLFSCAGASNNLAVTESIGEAFLRTGNTTNLSGAAACVGPSDPDTYSKFDGTIDQGMFWGLFSENITEFSPLLNRAKLELWLAFPLNRQPGFVYNSVECYFHIYNILGDPSMNVWKGTPDVLTVACPDSIFIGQNIVTAIVQAGNDPVEGAYAVITRSGEKIAESVSGADGMVNLVLPQFLTGVLHLTIAGDNCIPFTTEIQIIDSPAFIGYLQNQIDDDNIGQSSGNGDGQLNPGETIELDIAMQNFGSTPANSIWVDISTDNPSIELISTDRYYGDFGPWGIVENSLPFVFRVLSSARDGNTALTGVRAHGQSIGIDISGFELDIFAPEIQIESLNYPSAQADSVIFPGESSQLILTISNMGRLQWESLNCRGEINSTDVLLSDTLSVFSACGPGNTISNSSDPLFISVSEEATTGSTVTLILYFSTGNSWVDTMEVVIPLGISLTTDPTFASDGYRYICFDESDLSYSGCPEYEWTELDPAQGGSGTLIPLTDNVPFRGDQELIDLPDNFEFRYYGETVEDITVCSNGWICPGTTVLWDYQNKPIPSAGEPLGMIAPFWDDLMITGDAKVLKYYDQTNNVFIIEWSKLRNVQGNELESFEISLYDAGFYPTPTGDSPISFQYKLFHDVDYQNSYSTVGILNPSGTGGIQYLYSGIYSPGADTLRNNNMLYFTTDPGHRVDPPVLQYSPANVALTVQSGAVDSTHFYITNNGEADLSFQLNQSMWQADASGGPDAFGYIWKDSDDPGGLPIQWVDIQATGINLNFPQNDSTSANLPFGFEFPFYDTTFNYLIVSANGWISFTSHSNAYNNTQLPSLSAPPNLVAGFWDDLDPVVQGEVFAWSNQTDSVIVAFHNVEKYGSAVGNYTFEFILEANGRIALQYLNMGGQLNSATIGIQNADRTIGLTINNNQNYVHNNLRIDIQKPWLTISPLNGEVEGGETDSVVLIFDARDLVSGQYSCNMSLMTNDPIQLEPAIIPVTLSVAAPLIYTENLFITVTAEGMLLEWPGGATGAIYCIYRSEIPYFVPEPSLLIGTTQANQFLDISAPVSGVRFYQVIQQQ